MRHWLSVIFIICSSVASAQNLKQCLKYAETNVEEGDYYEACLLYEKALTYDSLSVHILHKYANALRAYNNYDKALYYYTKVVDKTHGRLYPEDRNDSTEWQITPLESNTVDADFSPLEHHNKLYLSSIRTTKQDGEQVKDDAYRIQIYEDNIPLDTIINSLNAQNGEACFSADGERMYFSRCVTGEPCHIYISRKLNNNWTKPDMVGLINEDNISSVQPFLTEIEDQEYLFYASNKSGGYGGLDIWVATVFENGNKYGIPKNLGKTINTPDDEITPYYNSLEGKLYFSSPWHKGFGGMDIFSSTGSPEGTFNAPRNLGKPINSIANDLYFKKTKVYKALLSSNREGTKTMSHSNCCNDIYRVEIPQEPKTDSLPYEDLEDLNRFLPVTLFFHNDSPNPNTLDTFTNLNYLSTYETYHNRLNEYKQAYSNGLKGEKSEQAKRDMDDFFHERIDKGVEDLEIFTQLLRIELDKGQNIEMTVQGYASPLAQTDYNIKLTYRRVSSMINYLKRYKGGILMPYIEGKAINGAKLSFNQIPFGEYTANAEVSDNPNDKKNSIFSIAAALERKIEIKSVQIANAKDSAYAEIKFDQDLHDFGIVSSSKKLYYTFDYTNTGTVDLIVSSAESSDPSVSIALEPQSLKPGDRASVAIEISPSNISGKHIITIMVSSNGFPSEKEIRLTLEVL